MLKKICPVLLLFALAIPASAAANPVLSQANAAFARAVKNNDLAGMRSANELFSQALELEPQNYDAMVGLARSTARIGDIALRTQAPGARDLCRKHGKLGMEIAKQAQSLNPKRPDAYFFEAWSISIYADGVSLMTALRENLMDRAKTGFQKSYNIDKNFNYGAPIIGLARFYQIMPWPIRDNQKALGYYQEYERLGYLRNSPDCDIAKNNYAELLIAMGGPTHLSRAKDLLQDLAHCDSALYSQQAQKRLKTL